MALRSVLWVLLLLFSLVAAAEEGAAAGRPCVAYLIGLGTQKGGTSSMHKYMQQGLHPRLKASFRKELAFWSGEHFTGGYTLRDYDLMFQKDVTAVGNVSLICPPPGSDMLRSAPKNPCSASMRTCRVERNTTSWGEEAFLPWSIPQDELPPLDDSPLDLFYLSENSPWYLFDPRVPARIAGLLPEARLYMILRNPVSRAVSAFNMMYKKRQDALVRQYNLSNDTTSSEHQALWAKLLHQDTLREVQQLQACYNKTGGHFTLQPEFYSCLGYGNAQNNRRFSPVRMDLRVVYNGVYADALQRFFSLFPARQFLIWNSDDFKTDTGPHIRDMIKWLGLDPELMAPKFKNQSHKLPRYHNRQHVGAAPDNTRRMLHDFYAPHNERLFRLLRAKGFGKVADRLAELWKFVPSQDGARQV